MRTSDRGSAVGLWAMSCVIGVATMVGVLVIHRRFPLSPFLLLGLIPGGIAAYYIFF